MQSGSVQGMRKHAKLRAVGAVMTVTMRIYPFKV